MTSICAYCSQIATHTGEGEDVCYGHVHPAAADEYRELGRELGSGLTSHEVDDLRERIRDAMDLLESEAQHTKVQSHARHLLSKRSGVALALDYLRAYGSGHDSGHGGRS